jgi:NADH-quinone oxidoreductase subunit C
MATVAQAVEKLKVNFADAILDIVEFRGETTVVVSKERIVQVCNFLKTDSDLVFDLLSDLCGVDQFQRKDRFEVVYNLYSIKNKIRLRLKVRVDEKDLHVPTVTSVWSTANWHERETFDMYGLIFDGHPDLRRMYMPEEYEYHPLRKDFPLMGIPDSIPLPRK